MKFLPVIQNGNLFVFLKLLQIGKIFHWPPSIWRNHQDEEETFQWDPETKVIDSKNLGGKLPWKTMTHWPIDVFFLEEVHGTNVGNNAEMEILLTEEEKFCTTQHV